MKDYIEERAVEIATYIIENNATVRQTAKQFGISKSTVHKDVTERLLQVRPILAAKARKVLDTNQSVTYAVDWLQRKNIYTSMRRTRADIGMCAIIRKKVSRYAENKK